MARLIAGIDKLALKIQMKIELANFFFLFFANIQIRPIKKKKKLRIHLLATQNENPIILQTNPNSSQK